MAATFGRIGEFKEGKEDWQQYVERLGHFFAANGITEENKKRSVFVSIMGPNAYKLLRSLISPAKPVISGACDSYDSASQSYPFGDCTTLQTPQSFQETRREHRYIRTFIGRICNFGATLDAMLRDRLVCGFNNDHIQCRLLSEAKLTYHKALELAQGLETAAKNVQELQGSKRGQGSILPGDSSVDSGIHKLSHQKKKRQDRMSCYRCGKEGHTAAKCHFKDVKCHNCGKIGHLRKVCRSTQKKSGSGRLLRDHSPRTVKCLEEEQQGETEEYALFQLKSSNRCQPLKVDLVIDSQAIVMEVDTGAALSLVSEAT